MCFAFPLRAWHFCLTHQSPSSQPSLCCNTQGPQVVTACRISTALVTVTANTYNHGFHQRCLRAPGKQEVSSAYCSLMLGSHAAASGFADCAFPYAVAAADSCEDASGGGWLEGMRGSCQQLRQSLFWRGLSESPLCARSSWFLPAQTS